MYNSHQYYVFDLATEEKPVDRRTEMYYASLLLHIICVGYREIPAPELDIKYLMEEQLRKMQDLVDGIKEGE